MTTLVWYLTAGAVVLGTALVFAGITASGLFTPGVILIDLGLLAGAAGGILELRSPASPAA